MDNPTHLGTIDSREYQAYVVQLLEAEAASQGKPFIVRNDDICLAPEGLFGWPHPCEFRFFCDIHETSPSDVANLVQPFS
jgi:hypothetical protein